MRLFANRHRVWPTERAHDGIGVVETEESTSFHSHSRCFLRQTLLHANGEDVKTVQELLRHGSAKLTMDVYAQAVTPAKRKAQGKVVAMLRQMEGKTA